MLMTSMIAMSGGAPGGFPLPGRLRQDGVFACQSVGTTCPEGEQAALQRRSAAPRCSDAACVKTESWLRRSPASTSRPAKHNQPRSLNVSANHSTGAVRSLSSISHAWSIVWNALWRMRNGRFHDRIRLPSPALYARMVAT